MHHGLGADGRKIGLGAVASPDLDQCEVGVSGGNGLEGERAEVSLPADTAGVGRPSCGDGDEAIAVVAMDESHRLAIAAEEVACIDVDELKNLGVVLHLQGDGVDVASMVEYLLGEGGRNITGTVLTVDAGNTA